jgi:hypothetical protein
MLIVSGANPVFGEEIYSRRKKVTFCEHRQFPHQSPLFFGTARRLNCEWRNGNVGEEFHLCFFCGTMYANGINYASILGALDEVVVCAFLTCVSGMGSKIAAVLMDF